MQNIQKSWDGGYDISKSLKDLAVINLDAEKPMRDLSTKTNADEKKVDQEGLDIDWHEKLRIHYDREDVLKKGLKQAYSYIFSNFCTKTMRERVEEHPDFSTIENNPIELLKAIKLLMHDPVRAHYPMASMTEALCRLINIKQGVTENLVDYLKWFKQL